ncbi:hypothetical protein JCM10914A_36360 [Paenibacillus sp. JCM 10914]|uniref:hypothetical protein n=1 Tax=Paenibacillus sp. JCM 10914 TaxID=1236974 RepID=UPI00055F3267|nr:hypothetical protein [Paenibacillus sp. JCM 10914]
MMEEIRFTTFNTYGEFCFYVTENQIREFLDHHQLIISLEFFKNFYTPEQSRALFDWIKHRNQNKEGPANSR